MVNWSAVVGEFVGTFVLIVLGNGVVAGALLNKSKAQNADGSRSRQAGRSRCSPESLLVQRWGTPMAI